MKKISTSAFLAALLIATGACGRIEDRFSLNDGVVGGRDVTRGEDYSQLVVGLMLFNQGQSLGTCTGSILDDDLVLTAAHCLENVDQVKIVFGEHMNTPHALRESRNFLKHPLYNGASEADDASDVGLVRFVGGLPENYLVNELLPDDYTLKARENVILAGFGASEGRSGGGSRQLRVADHVPVKNPDYARTEVELDQSTQSGGHGGCYGDSGGPAFVRTSDGRLQLWGVTSRGEFGCATTSVYTDLRKHLPWIRQTHAQLRQGAEAPSALADR
jgi:secreted trypsin-like serine protease